MPAATAEYTNKVISGNPYRINRRATVINPNQSFKRDVVGGPQQILVSGIRVNEDGTIVIGGSF